jgi:hypothetical protein
MSNRLLIAVFAAVALSGCATSLKVEKLQDFTPQSKTFVLLSTSQWDSKIRTDLSKKGFKVLRFAYQNQVISEGKEGEIARVFNEAEARYGLTFTWEDVDRCIYNSSRLINGTFEITDIKTNEVLLVIEKGGWTGPCADPRGMVFEDLAEALLNAWK